MSVSDRQLMSALPGLWTSNMFWKGVRPQLFYFTLRSLRGVAPTLCAWSPSRALCPSLARLKQLEQEVVGGEQVRNEELQQKHSQRKKLADQRKEHLIRALTGDSEESENVLLDVYNSIQEEVYAKSQMLLKVQGKVSGLSWRGGTSLRNTVTGLTLSGTFKAKRSILNLSVRKV